MSLRRGSITRGRYGGSFRLGSKGLYSYGGSNCFQVGATVTTANAIAHPDTVINNNGSIFHLANSNALTVIPFCRNIARHNNPAISVEVKYASVIIYDSIR